MYNNKINYLIGTSHTIAGMHSKNSFPVFHAPVVTFVTALSDALRSDLSASEYPDIMAFAFWCRENAIKIMMQQHGDFGYRRGRGIVVQYAPANIPVHFAYLLVLGLLSGNATIIRISRRISPQSEIVIEHLKRLLSRDFQDISNMVVVCNFDHDKNINDWLGSVASSRTIWGGDASIAQLSLSRIAPGGVDISFAHRHSICLIDASRFLQESDQNSIAYRFYNDTLTFDQKACSSASIVIWTGKKEDIQHARTRFWSLLEKITAENYPFEPAQALSKLEMICQIACKSKGKLIQSTNNLIKRIEMDSLGSEYFDCSYGLFQEYVTENLEDILSLCNEKLQTITTYGIDHAELHAFLNSHSVAGVDRITTIGRALEFSTVWDGTDLIELLSKKRIYSLSW